MKKLTSTIILSLILTLPCLAQMRSAKRGIGWAERNADSFISDAAIEKMAPGVSWIYTWGATPKSDPSLLGTGVEGSMDFAPMCWNGGYDANAIRTYVNVHSGVKYLLGFNEPNFSAQSNMTPEQAAEKWQGVEALAEELGLKLVAPALNFTGEKVGGRVWTIYEWLDEFIRVYKEKNGRLPKMDCLALHCYMDWYGSNTWFATEYFYKDLYVVNPGNNVVGKYPNIVEFLDTYKEANGHFPRMMLTEFCAWDQDCKNVDFQINQMTQKVQKLEQSDLVEGYAWFMANPESNSGKPWMGCFVDGKRNDSELSDLGKVYVYMSSFDAGKYYTPGEIVAAKDYVDASTDNAQVKLRPNTESGSKLPLQVELVSGAFPTYQIDVPANGEYKVTLHIKSEKALPINLYGDNFKKLATSAGVATGNAWTDYEIKVNLTAGKHNLIIFNAGTETFCLNSWKFDPITNDIDSVEAEKNGNMTVFSVNGVMLGRGKSLQQMNLDKGIYIVVTPNGTEKIAVE